MARDGGRERERERDCVVRDEGARREIRKETRKINKRNSAEKVEREETSRRACEESERSAYILCSHMNRSSLSLSVHAMRSGCDLKLHDKHDV